MPVIAPWLKSPDVLGAITAGAHVGLQGRAQDIQQEEAADRLRLAYDQLAAQEQRSLIESKRHADAAAQLREYRTGLLAHQQQMEKSNVARQSASEALRTRALDLQERGLDQKLSGKDLTLGVEEVAPGIRVVKGGGRWQLIDKAGKELSPSIARQIYNDQIKDIDRQLGEIGFEGDTAGLKAQREALAIQRNALLSPSKSLTPPQFDLGGQLGQPPMSLDTDAATPLTLPQSRAPIPKTNTPAKYRWVDGELVPIKEEEPEEE